MTKTHASKLKSFFEGRRRKASLNAWSHLRTKVGESRIKLDLCLPLLNESIVGMNEAISEAFSVMAKDESKIERTSLNVEMEGFTMEMFSTPDVKSPEVSSTGVKIMKLALVAGGEAEKRTLDLTMTVYIPASIQMRDWAWDHLHKDFHLEAIYSQSEMEFGEYVSADEDVDGPDSPAAEDEDIPFGDDTELDPDNEMDGPIIPARKTSGPKDLAAYHARQREKYKPNVN